MEITCPYCFERFNSKDVKLRCKSLKCPQHEDKVYMDFWRQQGFNNVTPETHHVYSARRKFLSTNKKCDVCGAEYYEYVCPVCHNELDGDMVANGGDIISVIGGPQSGKSHYIVALLQELLDNGFEIGLRAVPEMLGGDEKLYTATRFNEAKAILNEQRNTLMKTPTGQFTLPWIIRVESRNPREQGRRPPKKCIYLVFYDTAGEHFNSPEEIERNATYLRQSRAVIVLFDTLSIPKIKQALEANGEATEAADAATPFHKTWDPLENFIRSQNMQLTNKPFAFVLSKFDVVLSHSADLGFSINGFIDAQGRPIDRSYINGRRQFDVSQVNQADEKIRRALENRNIWNQPKYPEFVDQTWGDNARFFGMSAIGAMPENGIFIPQGGIKPYRVMDPLLWIMSKLGGFAFDTINA